ncbi:MAG: type II secretion system protein [Phycisphaerales bacterium]|nr:type II secretion system protein [Phycisphaerales bacterium]
MIPNSPIRNRRAFTLVELLVVISIIALLIAILLPSLKKARKQAKQTVCTSRLREIASAMWSYGVDNAGRVPYVISSMTQGGGVDLDGSPMPGFGDAAVDDAELDPFKRKPLNAADTKRVWAQSLPNALMPTYLGSEDKVFACPSALLGWPRQGEPFRMSYRPASANQLDGRVPTAAELAAYQWDITREQFGFLDGRIYKSPQPVRRVGDNVQSIIREGLEKRAITGTYLRDLVEVKADRYRGPHREGINVINKRMEVEFRDQDQINEELAPNGHRSVEF